MSSRTQYTMRIGVIYDLLYLIILQLMNPHDGRMLQPRPICARNGKHTIRIILTLTNVIGYDRLSNLIFVSTQRCHVWPLVCMLAHLLGGVTCLAEAF